MLHEQRRFLVDINLPYHFALWKSREYVHQADLGLTWTDEAIWEFATIENLTIVTKDSDFYSRILVSNPPPKVIYVRLGNMKMREFYQRMHAVWPDVLKLNQQFKLVKIYKEHLEAIN